MTHEAAIEKFIGRLVASLDDGSFVRLVLSSPVQSDAPVQRVFARLVSLHQQLALSLTLREKTRDVTRNLELPGAALWLRTEIGGSFRAALVETRSCDWQLSLPTDRAPRLTRHAVKPREIPLRSHDRVKHGTLDDTSRDWLHALGLVNEKGDVLPSRARKHDQIQRYAEILGHLVHECHWRAGASLVVADMGCGRGYLTFAAWQWLRRQEGFDVDVRGVDFRPELAQDAQRIVQRLGLEGLQFMEGAVDQVPLPAKLDILIALHACNTATDDALRRGIEAGARLLVVAPCCHQELRPQLSRPEPLDSILRHGIMAERLAEWLTDGLRALFLEWAGYRVKLVEFVSSEHTPKNLLLAGIRSDEAPFSNPALLRRILDLKSFFGIRRQALDPLLSRDLQAGHSVNDMPQSTDRPPSPFDSFP